MGSHLGVTLQAGVAARSYRRQEEGECERKHSERLLDGHKLRCGSEEQRRRRNSRHHHHHHHQQNETISSGMDAVNDSHHIPTPTRHGGVIVGGGESLLHLAVRQNRNSIVLREIRNGADVNVQSPTLQTPLHIACSKGHVEITQTLLKYGAELEVRNGNGETPLMVAKKKSHVHCVRLLVLQGCFVGRGTRQAIADGIRLLA